MRRCDEVAVALSIWSPWSGPDLPDRIALHIEDCPACMAVFSARFPALQAASPVPEAAPAVRWGRRVPVVALALLPLLIASGRGTSSSAGQGTWLGESALTAEEMYTIATLEPECPLPLSDAEPPVCLEEEWM